MEFNIRKWLTVIDERHEEAGQRHAQALRRVAVAAVIANPFLPGFLQDLQPWIDGSDVLGEAIGQRLVAAMGGEPVQSYGKAGLVGVDGEQEHANALLTTRFANPVRELIGGAKAWIPSVTKIGGPGSAIDIPLAHKDALYVRSHYDTLTVTLPDSPRPDEIVLIFAAGNRGRLNARVGGLQHDQVGGRDGLT
ncbi:amino acid synthesis family protein [Xylophilus sp. GOD-11R]|uniref:amino acid synthesis family protein n=1 Tax=Xylophilus sp. GOD-11R TaxID=3089814 RepID=UPI00298D50F6|nr:amino acid synthesis family protein [Xylophilus sp. GOD-11R]WPB54978.1 amino acid synthesis family protein [Xylophilus sp. GOD-11R]